MTGWVRLWHDMPSDPKWRTIARKSGQRIGDVIAVFNFIMVNASENATERGTLQNLDIEDLATALDLNDCDVSAILSAMDGKVICQNKLSGWGKRQPKREDSTAFKRKQAWLERKRTQENATERPDTDTDTDTDTSVSKLTDAASASSDPIDPEKIMFDGGVQLIVASGKTSASARAWLGKAKRDFGTEAVIVAIGAAKREGAIEPISFMQAALKKRKATSDELIFGVG